MATKKETAAAQAVENAVETVEKTEAMAEAKAEAKDDGMVTIHLFKDDDRYAAPVFVGVNGDSYLIQRGIDVKVPKAVAEVLEHSIKQDAEGMAAAIALLAKNATSGAALMDGTDSYNVDDASAKIRIPYAVYTG